MRLLLCVVYPTFFFLLPVFLFMLSPEFRRNAGTSTSKSFGFKVYTRAEPLFLINGFNSDYGN